jgi:hypothetical protein
MVVDGGVGYATAAGETLATYSARRLDRSYRARPVDLFQ